MKVKRTNKLTGLFLTDYYYSVSKLSECRACDELTKNRVKRYFSNRHPKRFALCEHCQEETIKRFLANPAAITILE